MLSKRRVSASKFGGNSKSQRQFLHLKFKVAFLLLSFFPSQGKRLTLDVPISNVLPNGISK